MIIRTNLNPRYVILVDKTLKEMDKDIAKAMVARDVDSVVKLICLAKDIKSSFKHDLKTAKRYQEDYAGTFLRWL